MLSLFRLSALRFVSAVVFRQLFAITATIIAEAADMSAVTMLVMSICGSFSPFGGNV